MNPGDNSYKLVTTITGLPPGLQVESSQPSLSDNYEISGTPNSSGTYNYSIVGLSPYFNKSVTVTGTITVNDTSSSTTTSGTFDCPAGENSVLDFQLIPPELILKIRQ